MPLQLAEGWNHLCLDLEQLTKDAFGTAYLSCVQVRVFANCRLLRAYFQDRPYADAELPEHLQAAGRRVRCGVAWRAKAVAVFRTMSKSQ